MPSSSTPKTTWHSAPVWAGAMSMSEYTPRRLKSGAIKANQLKATGAEVVVTSCHNCVDGLTDVIRYYKLGMEVTQLVHLVANALVIE